MTLFDRVFSGNDAVYGLTEGAIDAAIAQHGEDKAVSFPDTAYSLPCYYSVTGTKVTTLKELKEALGVVKTLMTREKRLNDAFMSGIATALCAEFIEVLKYIDGATPFKQFIKITIPLLKPTILMTAIMSTSGTLQLFDESMNLTAGGPGKSTMTLAHYIYNISFVETPKFNYAAALSVCILIMVAILSAIQMKVGDKRD